MPLADNNPNDLPLKIDVLIGADHYWDFIQNTVVRGESGPVAVSSNLGFILSGSVNTNFVSTHLLLIEQAATKSPSSTDVKNCLGLKMLISRKIILFSMKISKKLPNL